ncbi:hypothetical protein PTMSG1_04510 [Pyrenophora teres f. maculata]|nr:hypothetical protein PTMSG1_04510 [Pyrenophora teres f. maculata]
MAISNERFLRILTLSSSALTIPFLIATAIVSTSSHHWYRRNVTAFCFGFIPLAMTAFASLITLYYQRRYDRVPNAGFALIDGVAFCAYISILIPIWALEVGYLEDASLGMLAGYTTSPMILNMVLHAYIFVYKFGAMQAAFFAPKTHECPNCHNEFVVGKPPIQETSQGGERYSLLRGEEYLDADADAELYVEGAARPSGESVRPEGENKEEGKGKSFLDV